MSAHSEQQIKHSQSKYSDIELELLMHVEEGVNIEEEDASVDDPYDESEYGVLNCMAKTATSIFLIVVTFVLVGKTALYPNALRANPIKQQEQHHHRD